MAKDTSLEQVVYWNFFGDRFSISEPMCRDHVDDFEFSSEAVTIVPHMEPGECRRCLTEEDWSDRQQ